MKRCLVYLTATFFVLFLLISNLTYFNRYFPDSWPFRYCSDKCDFQDQELGKGRDPTGRVEANFEKYKTYDRNRNKNLVLHRRFKREWWQIWNWYDFLTERRWKYPYAERDADT